MKITQFLSILCITAFMSCEGSSQKQEMENNSVSEVPELYSDEDIQESENLEKDAEKLDQEIDEFVKGI